MVKKCPIFKSDCLGEECMGYELVEKVVPDGYPEKRTIRYENNRPITPTKKITKERCKYMENQRKQI